MDSLRKTKIKKATLQDHQLFLAEICGVIYWKEDGIISTMPSENGKLKKMIDNLKSNGYKLEELNEATSEMANKKHRRQKKCSV